ncbi:MAG: PAS domain-containing protein [Planctomycetes bacterium]|nr:PAS domain-containing protein [Planctomycetota bacterium]
MAVTAKESKPGLEDWVLRELPGLTYVCENDEFYTMRFLCSGSGHAFGYNLQDFVDNKHYFAASAIHRDDHDLVDHFAETMNLHARPIVARYRLVRADGADVPILVSARAVRNAAGKVLAIAGFFVDITGIKPLQGDTRILTDVNLPDVDVAGPVKSRPDPVTAAWLLPQLATVSYATTDDEGYTPVYLSGSLKSELGYDITKFMDAPGYSMASVVYPDDADLSDESMEKAAAMPGNELWMRLRVVNEAGQPVQVLCGLRGARHEAYPGGRGIVGTALYLHDVPALQGPSRILAFKQA